MLWEPGEAHAPAAARGFRESWARLMCEIHRRELFRAFVGTTIYCKGLGFIDLWDILDFPLWGSKGSCCTIVCFKGSN